jgi:hypothetical protein
MADDHDWVAPTIAKARQKGIDVPEAVWSQVEAVLRDKLSQRPIPAMELVKVAEQLIAAMALTAPGVGKAR